MDLDPNQVVQWLDLHPEFLSDYLRKSQSKQRCDSIISEYITSPNILSLSLIGTSRRGSTNISALLQQQQNNLNNNIINRNPSAFTASYNSSTAQKSSHLSLSEPNIIIGPLKEVPELVASNIGTSLSLASTAVAAMKSASPMNRNKFKQLSLYEKMQTLVKILYQSLDMRITCKKILNTVSLLLDADRCSLFLVVDDESSTDPGSSGDSKKKCLISVVFDAKSKQNSTNWLDDNNNNNKNNQIVNNSFSLENDDGTGDTGDEQIKIPYGVGIAGHVASTQQSLNIEDAYADSRFNPKIDQKTGYKTKSILCLPILNENGECIAVAEAINKIGDLYGSDDDAKDKFEKCEPISFSNEDEEVTFQYIRECRCLKVILD
jgi:hypothetical protein